jgi:hypothetical protein
MGHETERAIPPYGLRAPQCVQPALPTGRSASNVGRSRCNARTSNVSNAPMAAQGRCRAGRDQRIIEWLMLPLVALAPVAMPWPQSRCYLYRLTA